MAGKLNVVKSLIIVKIIINQTSVIVKIIVNLKKKNKKLQKEQKHETKEIRFSPNINDHDVEHKVKHAQEFIESGHEVDFTMKLRRRANKNIAKNRMQEIVERCKSFSIVKSEKYDFNFISVKLSKK